MRSPDVGGGLVAGLVARRIVCRVVPGQRLAAGERVGLIRFGSRVDVELPPGSRVSVRVGDIVQAGTTVIGQLAEISRYAETASTGTAP